MKMNIAIILLLVGCSKVEFSEKGCTPLLRYQLPTGTPFVILKITEDIIHHRIIKEELESYVAFQEEHDESPNNNQGIEFYVESDYIQLLGPIISYKKSPFDPFDTSSIFYYAEINNYKVWLGQAGLKIISKKFPSEINQQLEQKLLAHQFSSAENNKVLFCPIDVN
jgi:hypothetical protein